MLQAQRDTERTQFSRVTGQAQEQSETARNLRTPSLQSAKPSVTALLCFQFLLDASENADSEQMKSHTILRSISRSVTAVKFELEKLPSEI